MYVFNREREKMLAQEWLRWLVFTQPGSVSNLRCVRVRCLIIILMDYLLANLYEFEALLNQKFFSWLAKYNIFHKFILLNYFPKKLLYAFRVLGKHFPIYYHFKNYFQKELSIALQILRCRIWNLVVLIDCFN